MTQGIERIRLRKVESSDATFLWELANDPDVRSASFSKGKIPWEDHIRWFRKQLNNPSCIFLIATCDNTPIGQVRFEITGEEAVISVSIKKEYRGRNYGSDIIMISTKRIFDSTRTKKVHCYIKVGNQASNLAFQKANYKILGQCAIMDCNAFHLIKERDEINV